MIRKTTVLSSLVIFLCMALPVVAQQKSMMQQQSEYYSQFHFSKESQWDSLLGRPNTVVPIQNKTTLSSCALNNKRVFGWCPYWEDASATVANYQWNLISDLCYFDYTVTPSTGANSNGSFAFATSNAVTAAISHGVNTEICISLFSSHSTFFASPTAQNTLITNLISELNARGGTAKGVNVDFEGMPSSDKAAFTAFIHLLNTKLKTANPNYDVSIALYAVDWGPVFDIPNLNADVALYIIMGYDYYYGGSATAGPSDPLYDFETGYNYNHSKSITAYLKAGVPNAKLLLGVPYYGEEWATAASTAPSATSGTGNSLIYNTMKANASGNYSNANMHWEPNSFTPYFSYQKAGVWWQSWIDNGYSMGKRFDVVNERAIGGIGIWAMGYDNGYADFWNDIQNKFTNCAVIPCTDTIYDMGGPNRSYYDGEDYTYTIAPTGATSVSLTFSAFNVEAGKDTLWLFNGPSVLSPLIGKYTGANSPGSVGGTSPSITLRFKSAGTIPGTGYKAIWVCNGGVVPVPDTTRPTTAVVPPVSWVTGNFNCSFTDADNTGGSGVEKCFYQVCDYNGTEWRSNNSRGYFNDDFVGTTLNSDWTNTTGTWNVSAGVLDQTDQTQTNTNLSAALTQNLSNKYFYNWRGKITGTGTNRRAGLHIFCDSSTTTNRSNNYFVWFRVDNGVCEFYKTVHNTFSLVNSAPMTTIAGTWYDWKVVYDRITGVIQVYQNNRFIGSYADPAPISTGNYVSFRSGNCDWAISNFKVYRSRATNTPVAITAGSASSDMRYQNPSPAIAAGRVCTIARDTADNIANPNCQDFNVDWTPPGAFTVNDGAGADQDTTFSTTQLSANWSASADPNSALAKYWYAIGTTPGGTNTVNWTNNGTATLVTVSGLTLSTGQIYYFSVKSEDGAGLQSPVYQTDDGQLVTTVTGLHALDNSFSLKAFPNPFTETLTIRYTLKETAPLEMQLIDMRGRIFPVYANTRETAGDHQFILQADGFAKGIYMLEIRTGDKNHVLKLVLQ
jgi:spore germination protein YaaH